MRNAGVETTTVVDAWATTLTASMIQGRGVRSPVTRAMVVDTVTEYWYTKLVHQIETERSEGRTRP